MCAGAIAWSGIGRVVFGVSQARCYEAFPWASPPRFREPPSCRMVLGNVQPPVEVIGPLLEDEGLQAHFAFDATCTR
jgi:tRNA(Arg) A34 adenosine deaminase TadA